MPTEVTSISGIGFPSNNNNKYQGKIDQTVTQDQTGLGNSPLGTPLMQTLILKAGTYMDKNQRAVTFNDVTLINVLINVSQSKKIIETEIPGMDGTVKEYIGLGDYEISINGIIAGANGHYPVDEVNALHQLCKASVPIDVACRYLQNLDIYQIVIKDFAYDQEPGGYSKQNFSIQAVSDAPVFVQMANAVDHSPKR